MPLPVQQPIEEFSERAGETASGVLVIPQLIAVDDYRKNQAAARRRVNEAHAMHKRVLGMEDVGNQEGGGVATDDMGDIIYTGDISLHPGQKVKLGRNTTIEAEQEPAEPKPVDPVNPTQCKPDGKSWLPTVVLAASLLAGGSGIGYILHDLLKPPQPTPAGVDTDSITEFDFPKE